MMAKSAVTVFRTIDASPREVFAAWTTPALLQRWGVDRAETDPRPGGRFRQETGGEQGTHIVSGEFLEFVPDRRLVMTWIYEGPGAAARAETRVTVELRPDGSTRTEVTVTEDPILDAEVADAEAAWNGALDQLEALLGEAAGGT